MKTYKELVYELCDYFGFDDLYPYNDTTKIEKRFKEHLDDVYETRLKLLKLELTQKETEALLAQLKEKVAQLKEKVNK